MHNANPNDVRKEESMARYIAGEFLEGTYTWCEVGYQGLS